MCHTCWFGYNTPKWKAWECGEVFWRREVGKKREGLAVTETQTPESNELTYDLWAKQPMPYDPWFETEECLEWIRKDHPGLEEFVTIAIAEKKFTMSEKK